MMRSTGIALAALACCLVGGANAQEIKISDNSIAFDLQELGNAVLTVSGPNDYQASAFAKAGEIVIRLDGEGKLEDGVYTYELTAASQETKRIRNPIDNGRGDDQRGEVRIGVRVSGAFPVLDGKAMPPQEADPRSDQDRG